MTGALIGSELVGKLSVTVKEAVLESEKSPEVTVSVACVGPTVVPERTSIESTYGWPASTEASCQTSWVPPSAVVVEVGSGSGCGVRPSSASSADPGAKSKPAG